MGEGGRRWKEEGEGQAAFSGISPFRKMTQPLPSPGTEGRRNLGVAREPLIA